MTIKKIEILYKDQYSIDMPEFIQDGNTIEVKGRAMPQDAKSAWTPFMIFLEDYVESNSSLILNFKLQYFTSASSRFISTIIKYLQDNKSTCPSVINWYYTDKDEGSEMNGELYQETFPTMKINLIPVKGLIF